MGYGVIARECKAANILLQICLLSKIDLKIDRDSCVLGLMVRIAAFHSIAAGSV